MKTPTLDQRVTAFLRVYAAASVAKHDRQDYFAVARYMEAARIAPTCADETDALGQAFDAYERFKGPYVPSTEAH